MGGRRWRRALVWVGGIVVAAPLLCVGNYLFACRYLLRLDNPTDPRLELLPRLTSISTPEVLATGGYGHEPKSAQEFRSALRLSSSQLPETSEHLIPIAAVAKANPYPQPFDVLEGRDVSYQSFGYIGTDERYHQVTYYWGESDTTPSFLVRKVRGRETGWGDYFVRYVVYLSLDLRPHPVLIDIRTNKVLRWEGPSKSPDVDRID